MQKPADPWPNLQHIRCLQEHGSFVPDNETTFCKAVYDRFLCWAPTPAGTTAQQHCPDARLSDPTQLASRKCGEDGKWMPRRSNESSTAGWTNYTECFPAYVRNLFDQISDDTEQAKFDIARKTRILETVGLSLSLITLLIGLFIYTNFRVLRNSRTKIHYNLFAALVLQEVIRLTLYYDQIFVRTSVDDEITFLRGIDNIPYLCEFAYVLLEYGTSAMFMWMLLEGLYLHKLLSKSTLRDQGFHWMYLVIGWGFPVLLTLGWAITASIFYEGKAVNRCWYGYNSEEFYWILQGQRLIIILTNTIIIIKVIRVLVNKLHTSSSSDIEKIKKAVKATCILLPLLGITNLLDMCEPSLQGSVFRFACWSYVSHFLRSFQGVFICVVYCFMNAEVQAILKKYFADRKAIRETRDRQRMAFRYSGGGNSPCYSHSISGGSQSRTASEGTQTRLPTRPPWTRCQLHLRTKDTRISMPCIHTYAKRRSTGTDTGSDSAVLRRYSAHDTLGHTVANIEHERPIRMADRPSRSSGTLCPVHTHRPHCSYIAETST